MAGTFTRKLPDYKAIKTEAEGKIAVLEAKIKKLSNTSYMSLDTVEAILDDR